MRGEDDGVAFLDGSIGARKGAGGRDWRKGRWREDGVEGWGLGGVEEHTGTPVLINK